MGLYHETARQHSRHWTVLQSGALVIRDQVRDNDVVTPALYGIGGFHARKGPIIVALTP